MTALTSKLSNMSIDELCINTIRFLAVDAVQKAQSGHAGTPMGSAAMAYALWDRLLKFNPHDPAWPDRDRFVLSCGHACLLQYALLHLTGFDLALDEIKRFRQWKSKCPGHPEFGMTPGIEATTGPLGQGFANAVGMAIAETILAARFNLAGHAIVDHYTYCLCSDGDLEEGLSSEAAGLAGHLKLGKLIVLYADNRIQIEGGTNLAFTEDRVKRFAAQEWHVQQIEDGNDVEAVTAAIRVAQAADDRPSMIAVRTHIGYGSPHKQDTHKAHSDPLGDEEVKLTKENLGWPLEPTFLIPPDALVHFRKAVDRGSKEQSAWNARFDAYAKAFPELATEFRRIVRGELPVAWDAKLPSFAPSDGAMATRVASGKMIKLFSPLLAEFIGGSADLGPSNKTTVEGGGDFQSVTRSSRNIHFGVREHAMGGLMNGMALHGLIPYGGTFLREFLSAQHHGHRSIAAAGEPQLILVATGSEVHLALAAWEQLSMQGAKVGVVSVPCVEVFSREPQTYRDTVLPCGVTKLVIEAGLTLGWRSYFESAEAFVGVEGFGASAPGDVVMREYGFTVQNICRHAERMLKNHG